jgi:hypothetical protein
LLIMVDFTKALVSFAWAQSLFGTQQALNLLTPRSRDRPGSGAAAAFQAVADAAGGELQGFLRTAYELGGALQSQAVDRLSLNVLNPFAVGRVAAGALRQSVDVVRLLASPEDLRLAWQEFRDKMRVFFWVREVGSLLDLPRDGSYVPLTELVARAYALDPFPALWAVEGAGHYYADSLRTGDQYPRDLLTDARAAAVPDSALTMLHAGIGLSFADNLLDGLTAQSPADQVRDVVRRFLALCRQNSRPGYVGAALESLGLAARDFHPQALVPLLDRALAELDPDAQAFFWHGVGRGIYFSPTYFLPVGRSPWQAVEMAKGEALHELGRLNAIAGLAWAVTMVNLLKPQVLAAVVRQHADEFARDDAFSYGVASSIAMRCDTTPGQEFIGTFCLYQPSDPGVAAAWEGLVKRACQESLGGLYPLLKKAGRLGELFRYQTEADLLRRLGYDAAAVSGGEKGSGTWGA